MIQRQIKMPIPLDKPPNVSWDHSPSRLELAGLRIHLLEQLNHFIQEGWQLGWEKNGCEMGWRIFVDSTPQASKMRKGLDGRSETVGCSREKAPGRWHSKRLVGHKAHSKTSCSDRKILVDWRFGIRVASNGRDFLEQPSVMFSHQKSTTWAVGFTLCCSLLMHPFWELDYAHNLFLKQKNVTQELVLERTMELPSSTPFFFLRCVSLLLF